ncbi:hypothetical protein CFAM422_010872 [Trichoderma lentiforme]|uniref:Uncharacterized protein n=1 Tax=Trichoderma lentiforme TaxID=1567552 RepID=A0A9P4X542_9HYPO|nr:hypothetical protein CFAM422_010872 [Trichoderma lentiforme]
MRREGGIVFVSGFLSKRCSLEPMCSPHTPSAASSSKWESLGVSNGTPTSSMLRACSSARWGAKMVAWRSQMPNTLSHFTDKKNDKSYVIEHFIDSERSKFEFAEEKRTIWDRILLIRRTRIAGKRQGEGMKSTTKQVGYRRIPLVNATVQGTHGRDKWVIEIITCI